MKLKVCLLSILLLSVAGWARTRPFNLSLTPDIAVFDRSDTINGVTLSIWGENEQKSLALGLVNGTSWDSGGASLGIINYAENYKGLQWGVVNYASADMSGWQGGFVFGIVGSVFNYTRGDMTGIQSGLVNLAGTLSGVQVGVVNHAMETGKGLQVGFVNLLPENEWFTELPNELAPAMIFVNWRF